MARSWSVGVGCIVVVALCAAAWSTLPATRPAPPSEPRLACQPEVHVGTVELNTIAEGRFTVANAGGGELVLSDFRTGCACEALERDTGGQFARFETIRLAANESAVIRHRRTVSGVVGEPMQSIVRFNTNDVAAPEAAVAIVVDQIIGGLLAVPPNVVFGAVPVGPTRRATVELFDVATPARAVERFVCDNPTVRVTLGPPDADRAATPFRMPIGRLQISVEATEPGEIDATISVYVAGRSTPELIRVTGRVTAPVEVSPRVVYLPRASSSGPLDSADVLVQCLGGGGAVVECPTAPAGIEVTVHPSTSSVCRVTVSVIPGIASGEYTVPLSVRVGDSTHTASIRIITQREGGGL